MRTRLFTKPITVVLSETVYSQLHEIMLQNNYSISEWVRDAITIKLANLLEIKNDKGDK
jgi:hypothetical protein